MAAPILKVYTTISDKLNDLSVINGQLIFVSDTKTIYLDNNGVRLSYDIIQVLKTDKDRIDIKKPKEGFYFVEDSAVLWRYKNQWVQLTRGNVPHIILIDKYIDLPSIGENDTIYSTENAVYVWDNKDKKYVSIANKTEWDRIGV